MRAQIVLGTQFGDEGKGATVDYLCSHNPDSLVVRFSGGQQAAHNVVIGDKSHIHSSYGSGTLRGLPSYFTEHCCIYPSNMMRERGVLTDKGCKPELFLHPFTKVTTPYDVACGRVREKKIKHGSIGMGIAATMMRNAEFKLHAIDLTHKGLWKAKMEQIALYYNKFYRDILGPDDQKYYDDEVEKEMPSFEIAVRSMPWQIEDYFFLHDFENVIFEGSQGIMLDMDIGVFPHVTYANTTAKNALDVCQMIDVVKADTYYVTRCYSTRHGNGWFPDGMVILDNTHGETNVWNEWQEGFRTGEIDYDLINHAMTCNDTISSVYDVFEERFLVVTCLDQRPGFKFDYGKIKMKMDGLYENNSPSSSTFKLVKHEKVDTLTGIEVCQV